jgi:hypothetical protein
MKKASKYTFGTEPAPNVPSPTARRLRAVGLPEVEVAQLEEKEQVKKLMAQVANEVSRHPGKAAFILAEWLKRDLSSAQPTPSAANGAARRAK